MKVLSVTQTAERWQCSERSVRDYCSKGRVPGAVLTGKTWGIPENAKKPQRKNKKTMLPPTLLDSLKNEKNSRTSGGIYHKVQIDLTYNSNHIEGSMLSHEQTRFIFETATIGITEGALNVDDIIETTNHFRCIDYILDHATHTPSEKQLKDLHYLLKNGTEDSRKPWFALGEYKKMPNEVGGMETVLPEDVHQQIQVLLKSYNTIETKTLDDLLQFHVTFERIHPFQDGNGRVGRLILFKECLRHNIVPFIISEGLKIFYYRGLKEWDNDKGYLRDTCLTAQDQFQKAMDYFRIPY